MQDIALALETRWKIWNEVWRRLAYPRIRLIFAMNGIAWGEGWRLFGVPIIQKHKGSQISLGSGLQLRSSVRSNPIGPNHPVMLTTWQPDASLKIGNDFAMTGGVICAADQVSIGDDVTIGANSTIIDSDFHPLNQQNRKEKLEVGNTAPVVVEDGVFIGMSSLVLKGVTVGSGAVVGAGSVITKDVPPGAIVAGNPARLIGILGRSENGLNEKSQLQEKSR